MASFIVRVEILKPKARDYEELHKALGDRGFKRSVQGPDGKEYKLPSAEYLYIGEASVEFVRDIVANTACRATTKKFSVLVAGEEGFTFSGLELA